MWQRRRGRKKRRQSPHLIARYLDNTVVSFTGQAAQRGMARSTVSARVKQALLQFLEKNQWLPAPPGPLIAVADGIVQTVSGELWTIYVIALRSLESCEAVIMPPVLLPGSEHGRGRWQEALDGMLTVTLRERICAVVADGERSLIKYAKQQGWHIQRCHFHLRMKIAHYAGTGPLNRNRGAGLQVATLVNDILLSPDPLIAEQRAAVLASLVPLLRSRGLKEVLGGFLKTWRDFRTYLTYPVLHLPATTNSMESYFSFFRDLQRKAKGFNSILSLKRWLLAFCKHRQTITCNGKPYPQN